MENNDDYIRMRIFIRDPTEPTGAILVYNKYDDYYTMEDRIANKLGLLRSRDSSDYLSLFLDACVTDATVYRPAVLITAAMFKCLSHNSYLLVTYRHLQDDRTDWVTRDYPAWWRFQQVELDDFAVLRPRIGERQSVPVASRLRSSGNHAAAMHE